MKLIKVNQKHSKKVDKNKIIKVYLDHLLYSHFDFPYYRDILSKKGIIVTKNPKQADIILSSYEKYLVKYSNKKLLLWTHEPYHSFINKSRVKIKNKTIHCMTVYTGDIFVNNYRYFCFREKLQYLTKESFPTFKNKGKIAAFSTKYPKSYYHKNQVTLLPKRYEIIKWGYEKSKLKIWGKGWGKMAEGESRNKNRVSTKLSILSDYDFNLAIENANSPYYVTEKIWESIASYTLPIYYKNSTIYDDFPENSFLDYSKFGGPRDLFKKIENMSLDEYRDRMNKCIDIYNRLVIRTNEKNLLKKCPKNINLERVDYEQSLPPLIYFFKKKV